MQAVALQHLKQQFGMIGQAPSLNRAMEIAIQVAPTALSVLIMGESGTGKESFSKLIHTHSPYKHGKFIVINCGAIPEGTIDSELFGHEKGAFTGATDARKGYFEEADGGTIFLDEIGDMPLSTQTKLLRVLEYGEFVKVGSSKIQKIKVRVVAATNVDLLQAIQKGTFREDLYYRLNTVPIHVPPLRERGTDIMLLFLKFSTEFADRYYTKPLELSEEAQATLLQYRFPGNIRQLKNLVEQMSVLEVNRNISKGILQSYLPADQQGLPALYKPATAADTSYEREFLYKLLVEMKKEVQDYKRLIFDFFNTTTQGKELIQANPMLFKKAPTVIDMASGLLPDVLKEVPAIPPAYRYPSQEAVPTYAYLSTPSENNAPRKEIELGMQQEESLSIEAKEKELITKALMHFKNKRKQAAQALGISERTLYRKIHQYKLE